MLSIYFKLAITIAVMSLCAQTAASDPKEKLGNIEIEKLNVEINDSDKNFTIINSRMDETATAAVLFGLIGAAVNSATNASEDKQLTDVYRETAADIDLAGLIEQKLTATLQQRVDDLLGSAAESSHDLTVHIKDWGMIRVANDNQDMRLFLNLRVVMKDGRKIIWDTRRHDAGKYEAEFSEFTDEILVEQATNLAERAGQRIAFEIIYR